MSTAVLSRNPKSKHTDLSLPDYVEGTPVMTTVEYKEVLGFFSHWTKLNEAYIKLKGSDKPVWRKPGKFTVVGAEHLQNQQEETPSGTPEFTSPYILKPKKQFNINQRFQFLSSLVRMTCKAKNNSMIITGDGGLGKTFTVMRQVELSGLVEDEDYVVIKGYSTAKGMYNTLYHNSDKLIIFDDCDSVLENDISTNILKGALDSYDKRIVHWVAQSFGENDIPSSFEFVGRIIFISNKNRTKFPQALISRSTCIDVSMTPDEKIERMRSCLASVRGDVSMEIKEEALSLLEKYKNDCTDLNFRTLLKIINIRVNTKEDEDGDWTQLAEYFIFS